jgi:nucleotide-binding universal stress UspA family protein
MKKILVAVDFSDATPVVVAKAVEMAIAFGADLHLLHVVEPEPTYTAYGFTPDEFPAIQTFHAEARKRAQKSLEDLVSKTAAKSGIRVIGHLEDGRPLVQLEISVKEIGADLVILGSHGHGVVASLLLGSVAEGMVRKAIIATLIVPARKPGK